MFLLFLLLLFGEKKKYDILLQHLFGVIVEMLFLSFCFYKCKSDYILENSQMKGNSLLSSSNSFGVNLFMFIVSVMINFLYKVDKGEAT